MAEDDGRKVAGRRLEALVHSRWKRSQGGIRGLAAKLGCAPDTVYSWFRGEHPPDAFDLETLAALLGLSRWEIVAAMDGVEAIDLAADSTRAILLELIDQSLDARGVLPQRVRPRDGAA